MTASAVAASAGALCDKHDDAGAPAQDRCDHAGCCLLCGCAGRDATFVALAAAFFVVTEFSPNAAPGIPPFFPDAPAAGDFAGRSGAWSSRAPPFFPDRPNAASCAAGLPFG
jgi:hypothetical protein